MVEIADIIEKVLKNCKNPNEMSHLAQRVKTLCQRFPIY